MSTVYNKYDNILNFKTIKTNQCLESAACGSLALLVKSAVYRTSLWKVCWRLNTSFLLSTVRRSGDYYARKRTSLLSTPSPALIALMGIVPFWQTAIIANKYSLSLSINQQSTCWRPVGLVTYNISSKAENSFNSAILSRHCFI